MVRVFVTVMIFGFVLNTMLNVEIVIMVKGGLT